MEGALGGEDVHAVEDELVVVVMPQIMAAVSNAHILKLYYRNHLLMGYRKK